MTRNWDGLLGRYSGDGSSRWPRQPSGHPDLDADERRATARLAVFTVAAAVVGVALAASTRSPWWALTLIVIYALALAASIVKVGTIQRIRAARETGEHNDVE